jgi:oligopeptidase A
MSAENPLLSFDQIPRFDEIRAEEAVPAVRAAIERQDEARAALEGALESGQIKPTWESLAAPLSALAEPLSYAWNVVHHLLGVKNGAALRAAQETVQPEVVAAALRLGQSRALYRGFRALRDSGAPLEAAQRRIVETSIREAELAGVGLDGEARERFQKIEEELAEASTRFANNLLDATKAFALVLTERAEVEGLPPACSPRPRSRPGALTTRRSPPPRPRAARGASRSRRRSSCRSSSTAAGATCASASTAPTSRARPRASSTTSRSSIASSSCGASRRSSSATRATPR